MKIREFMPGRAEPIEFTSIYVVGDDGRNLWHIREVDGALHISATPGDSKHAGKWFASGMVSVRPVSANHVELVQDTMAAPTIVGDPDTTDTRTPA